MPYTFLAVGDSYTIGEGVPLYLNFPYQTTQLLRKENVPIAAPEIMAKTGWTTDELYKAIEYYTFSKTYDIVTLLIGVNNQYRGGSIKIYKKEFEELLQKAIEFAGGIKQHVFVLSIPDYSITPFAKAMDGAKIRNEIEGFNAVNKAVADRYGITYINITESTREAKNNVDLLADDGLHPSAAEYHKWALLLAQKLKQVLP